MGGTVVRLIATLQASQTIVAIREDNSEPVYSGFMLRGEEIDKEIKRRARNVLSEVAFRILDSNENDSLVVECIRTILALRSQL